MVPVPYDGSNIEHILFCVNSGSQLFCQISRGSDGEESSGSQSRPRDPQTSGLRLRSRRGRTGPRDQDPAGELAPDYQNLFTQTNIKNPSNAVKKCECAGARREWIPAGSSSLGRRGRWGRALAVGAHKLISGQTVLPWGKDHVESRWWSAHAAAQGSTPACRIGTTRREYCVCSLRGAPKAVIRADTHPDREDPRLGQMNLLWPWATC